MSPGSFPDFPGFVDFSLDFRGQNRSKKNPQGRGSYLTKYGPTISRGDPAQAPNTFWTSLLGSYKLTEFQNVHLGVYPKSQFFQNTNLENEFLVVIRQPAAIIKRLLIDSSLDSLSMGIYGCNRCMTTPIMLKSVFQQICKYIHLGGKTFLVVFRANGFYFQKICICIFGACTYLRYISDFLYLLSIF